MPTITVLSNSGVNLSTVFPGATVMTVTFVDSTRIDTVLSDGRQLDFLFVGGLWSNLVLREGGGSGIVDINVSAFGFFSSPFSLTFAGDSEAANLTGFMPLILGLSDVVAGAGGNDSLIGVAGNDSIGAGGGNDTGDGGAGNDTLDGGSGTDLLRGGGGNDVYYVDAASDVVDEVTGGGGIDLVRVYSSFTLPTGVENGEAALGALDVTITGNSANNKLTGGAGDDTLFGGLGDDELIGMEGGDVMRGGAGNDIYEVTAGDEIRETGGGVDAARAFIDFTLPSTLENLTLGGTGDISGTGNKQKNNIKGNAGNNPIDGGTGADTMAGGQGNDQYYADNPGDLVSEDSVNGGIDTLTIAYNGGLGPTVENLVMAPGVAAALKGSGNALANEMYGNEFDNQLFGLANPDSIAGGEGNDILDGGTGADSMVGGTGNDTFGFDHPGDVVEDEDGNDLLVSSINIDLADIGAAIERVQLAAVATALRITGNGEANHLAGNAGANSLAGDAGADTLDGGTGADSMAGGAGDDTYIVDNAEDKVSESGGDGTDTVRSSLASFSLASTRVSGEVENLVLAAPTALTGIGNSLENVIAGNAAANSLDGGTGADQLIGGLGNDTYRVDSSEDEIEEAPGAGIDTEIAALAEWTLAENVENAIYVGNAGASVSGNSSNNSISFLAGGGLGADTLDGLAGSDTMAGGAGNDIYYVDSQADVIVDTGGFDTVFAHGTYSIAANAALDQAYLTDEGPFPDVHLTGNALNNFLNGNAGNNSVSGGAGADVMRGLAGSDTMEGGAGNDQLYGGTGSDMDGENDDWDVVSYANETAAVIVSLHTHQATGAAGVDLVGEFEELWGGKGNDSLTGDYLANRLVGGAGADTLNGGGEADTLVGGDGNDRYSVAGEDLIVESAAATGGVDTVETALAEYSLAGGLENLVFTASAGATMATGNAAANLMSAAAADDLLDGGAGADTLSSGEGSDTLIGGAGADSLAGGLGNDSYDVDSLLDKVLETTLAGAGSEDLIAASLTYSLETNATVEFLTLAGTGNFNGAGNAAANRITGNAGNNLLRGLLGADTLAGEAGADTLEGGAANDSLAGGDDSDTAAFVNETAAIVASLTSGLATGAGADTMSDVENLVGGKGNDSLGGNEFSNTLDGSLGADTLVGLDGDDTYGVDNLLDRVSEADSGGEDTVRSSVNFTLSGAAVQGELEHLVLLLTAANGTGNTVANRIEGNAASNLLVGQEGADTLIGGSGADTLNGGADADIADYSATTAGIAVNLATGAVTGGAGNDSLVSVEWVIGGSGADTFTGGSGNDTFDGAGGEDWVFLTGMNLEASVDAQLEDVFQNIENIRGGAGNDTLAGDAGDNRIEGGAGNDSIDGGDSGGGGDWLVYNTAANVKVSVNLDTLTMTSVLVGTATGTTAGTDSYTGIENVLGGLGGDELAGDEGENFLDGGAGADTLSGGDGADTYGVDSPLDRVTEDGSSEGDAIRSTQSIDLRNGTVLNPIVSPGSRGLIENVTLLGTATQAFGNDLDNLLVGNAAANTLSGGFGLDVLDGGGGADSMAGGADEDEYRVDNPLDKVFETASNDSDTVFSSASFTLPQYVERLILAEGSATLNGTGGVDANYIEGNAGANILDGKGGADTMVGGEGNDTYVVDNPGDAVSEADPDDEEAPGGGVDLVRSSVTFGMTPTPEPVIGPGDVVIFAAELSNAAYAESDGIERLELTGTGNIDGYGNELDNLITGNDGSNTMHGGLGADTLIGGKGNDAYFTESGDVVVELAGGGSDTIVWGETSYALGANIENLIIWAADDAVGIGNELNNAITGGSGADSLSGGLGNDSLAGNAGADTLVGGLGNDTIVIDADDVYIELAGGGTDALASYDIDVSIAALPAFENVLLLGEGNLSGTGNATPNVIDGNDGDNELSGAAGADTLRGGEGADTLDGGAGIDLLMGGGGDDVYIFDVATDKATEATTLPGGGTHDLILTPFATILVLGIEDVTLLDSAAPNVGATGTAVANILTGNLGNNLLAGLAGDDRLYGGEGGADTLDGGLGADTMAGGDGNDSYVVDNLADSVEEGESEGTDTVTAMVGGYTLASEVEALVLGGTAARGTGNDEANRLTGNAAANTLEGAGGADTLNGGAGNDSMAGGEGDDVFVFDPADGVVNGGGGADILRLGGTGTALDLTAAAFTDARFVDMEAVDLTGTGNNTLKLSSQDILDFTDVEAPTAMYILGDVGDAVIMAGGQAAWTDAGRVTVSEGPLSGLYDQYTLAANPQIVLNISVDVIQAFG